MIGESSEGREGFSVLELLLVLTIVATIFTLLGREGLKMGEARRLSVAADLVVRSFQVASRYASSHGVNTKLLVLCDATLPELSFRQIVVAAQEYGGWQQVGHMTRLPKGILIVSPVDLDWVEFEEALVSANGPECALQKSHFPRLGEREFFSIDFAEDGNPLLVDESSFQKEDLSEKMRVLELTLVSGFLKPNQSAGWDVIVRGEITKKVTSTINGSVYVTQN